MTKKCKVVRLLQNKTKIELGDIVEVISDSPYCKSKIGELFIFNIALGNNADWQSQHLYLVSDGEIEEGDYCLVDGNTPWKYNSHVSIADHRLVKIIASTDLSLNLPYILQSFLQSYVKNQGKIDDINIEMTEDGEIQSIGWKTNTGEVTNDDNGDDKELEEAASNSAKYYIDSHGRGIYLIAKNEFKNGWKACEEHYDTAEINKWLKGYEPALPSKRLWTDEDMKECWESAKEMIKNPNEGQSRAWEDDWIDKYESFEEWLSAYKNKRL